MGKYDTGKWAAVLGRLTDILDIQAVQDYVDKHGIALVWPDGIDPNALQMAIGSRTIVAGSWDFWAKVFEPAMEELDRRICEVIARCTGREWEIGIREWGGTVELALALTEIVGSDALDRFSEAVLKAQQSDDPFAVVTEEFCRLATLREVRDGPKGA